MRGFRFSVVALTLSLAAGCDSTTDDRPTITVFAAASATDLVDAIADRFTDATGVVVRRNIAGSSTLARQIEHGAPADLFLSADREWMDYLEERDLLEPGSRRDVVGNQLVLIVPAGTVVSVQLRSRFMLDPDFDPLTLLDDTGRLALGDPQHLPAGRYAQRELETLGWWTAVRDRVVPALDVRAALRLVELGEADAGIVYATDAAASERVDVLAWFPARSDDPIHYSVALCRGASHEAAAFLEFLGTKEAREILVRHGFIPLGADPR